MAVDARLLPQPHGLTVIFGATRPKAWRLGRWATLTIVAGLPLVVTWCLAATAYFIFHDQLVAALMARQSDMQYSYEDKIAVLKSDLDREESRGLLDRHTLETTLHDLTARGEMLSTRAATLDALVTRGLRPAGVKSANAVNSVRDTTSLSAFGESPSNGLGADLATDPAPTGAMPAGGLRLDGSAEPAADDGDGSEKRSDLSPLTRSQDVAALYDRVAQAQVAILSRLRGPVVDSVARVRVALAETGLPESRWPSSLREASDVGGPFVPIPEKSSESSFDENAALLRDAIHQQAQLDLAVDRVPLRRPLEGPLEVTSAFGPRLDPFLGKPAMHTGIDLREDVGDAVEATAAGVVTIAGSEGGYGNMVEINHGNGLATRYAHLSAIDVVPHQMVPAGYIVGRVGSTGRATGPHLHYETRINGEPVDPARFLKASLMLFPE